MSLCLCGNEMSGNTESCSECISEKKEIMTLEIDGAKISTDWWNPEIKELFCSLCKEDGNECNKMTCLVANPWCG